VINVNLCGVFSFDGDSKSVVVGWTARSLLSSIDRGTDGLEREAFGGNSLVTADGR